MSQPIDDGGYAFPVCTGDVVHAPGMKLREWLAGQALAGLLADPNSNPDMAIIARVACMHADAVITELNRTD